MGKTVENTGVVIVGTGVAGLALGNSLLRGGINCVILEQHSRDHVERRQRAGALDGRGVRMLREWGLGEVMGGYSVESAGSVEPAGMPLRIDGEAWPDERVWSELGARFGEPVAVTGPIADKQLVPLRCVVYSPMNYGGLYLLGDAAHIVSPTSAKGMNLALHDAEVFARAVIRRVEKDDSSLLDNYSETCLRHIWKTQLFAVEITETVHNAGDASYEGEFRTQLVRVELERMIE
jgi:2-polyprenyl-6-methoxyphenol hydroxylase-like FAD-dependent oxidoreductase